MDRPPEYLELSDQSSLAADLLDWFAAVKRDLPWRLAGDLYGIWVSEVMLQQTTVQTVIPYWEQFMAQFPDVATLAAAPEDEVLTRWAGLGYYSRARHLHAAARIIVTDHGGRMPGSREAWAALPGIGPYASGAIASIGLGEAVPALDANARRVLQRWAVNDPATWSDLSAGKRQQVVDRLGAELVPIDDPGRWNEAVMELGALVCGARKTKCDICPVHQYCNAWTGQWITEVPPPSKKAVAQPVWVGQLLVTWRDQVLLVPSSTATLPIVGNKLPVARSEFGGLFQGLWGLPMTPWMTGHSVPELATDSWWEWLSLSGVGPPPKPLLRTIGSFRHSITKYRLKVAVLHLELDPRTEVPDRWCRASTENQNGAGLAGGRFVAIHNPNCPLSKLAEKALHFHQDSLV